MYNPTLLNKSRTIQNLKPVSCLIVVQIKNYSETFYIWFLRIFFSRDLECFHPTNSSEPTIAIPKTTQIQYFFWAGSRHFCILWSNLSPWSVNSFCSFPWVCLYVWQTISLAQNCPPSQGYSYAIKTDTVITV